MGPLTIPRNLAEAAEREGRQAWLATSLPALVRAAQQRWRVRAGEPFQPGGQTAWVAPADDGPGTPLVIKIAWRHPEAEHEADGLRAWAGNGAVRLRAATVHPDAVALLIERCVPGTPLSRRPEPEQDTVIAGLLRRLWIEPPPGHRFRTLRQMCEQWVGRYERQAGPCAARPGGPAPPGGSPRPGSPARLDPGLARAGIALFRELPATAPREVLLCTDLHAGNVLAAEREPWLVVDPKPHIGDPAYDVLQHLLNCEQRLRADPHGLARRMAGLLGLDPERVLLWLFARCVLESAGCPSLAEVARLVAPG